jgi:hypothetical protein
MAEGRIGAFTWKPHASKEELGGGLLGIIKWVSTKKTVSPVQHCTYSSITGSPGS